MHNIFSLLAGIALIGEAVATTTSSAKSALPTDGLIPKQLNAIRRRPGLTHKEYLDYHVLVHGSLAYNAPPVSRPQVYVQDHIFDSVFGTNTTAAEPAFFGRDDLTELYCNNVSQFQQSLSNPYVREVIGPNGANFNDFPFAVSMFAYEVFVSSPATTPNSKCAPNRNNNQYYNTPGTATAFYWLSATNAGINFDNATFAVNVNNALQKQLLTYAPKAVYNASIHIPITGTDSRMFYGGGAAPPMSAVIKLFLCDCDTSVDAFRNAQKALQSMTSLGVNFDNSFVAFAKEVTLWNFNLGINYNTTRLTQILKTETTPP